VYATKLELNPDAKPPDLPLLDDLQDRSVSQYPRGCSFHSSFNLNSSIFVPIGAARSSPEIGLIADDVLSVTVEPNAIIPNSLHNTLESSVDDMASSEDMGGKFLKIRNQLLSAFLNKRRIVDRVAEESTSTDVTPQDFSNAV
jgi:hypothetical protein